MLYRVRQESRDRDYPQPHDGTADAFVGRWAVLGYYVPAGLMHPEDVQRYLDNAFKGEMFYCCFSEPDAGFVKVRNVEGYEFRVNPKRVIWIATPRFQLGDPVLTKVGTQRTGWVIGRGWHYKDKRVYYHIEIMGVKGRKKVSRRYWDDEIALSNQGSESQANT